MKRIGVSALVFAILVLASGGCAEQPTQLKPPHFEVSQLLLEPVEIRPGESVTVTVVLSNIGEEQGTYDAELIVDGSIAETKSVTLLGGESTTLSFEIVREAEGHYTVEIGGLTSSFEVRAPTPAEFELSELVVEPAECLPGQVVTATVVVSNVGEEQGTYHVELTVDGSTVETKSITLRGGESTTVSFEIVREAEGQYTVEIGGLTATFQVITVSWALVDRPYLLTGRGAPYSLASALLGGGGLLGGYMQHIYDHLDIYIDQIARVDSVLLFNTAAEHPELLRDWPEEYSFLFPFELEELYELKRPFGYFKRDELGYLRGVIMADNEEDIINLGVHMSEHEIPVGQPYVVSTEGDITAQVRDLIRGFWDPGDMETEGEDLKSVGDRVYVLNGRRASHRWTRAFLRGGGLGGSMQYIYDHLDTHASGTRHMSSVLFFNTAAEDPELLRQWPEEYSFLFPFELEELYELKLPFGYFKRDELGYLRGVIMADNEEDIINLGVHLTEHRIPVGQPYTVTTNGDIVAEIRNLIRDFWDAGDVGLATIQQHHDVSGLHVMLPHHHRRGVVWLGQQDRVTRDTI